MTHKHFYPVVSFIILSVSVFVVALPADAADSTAPAISNVRTENVIGSGAQIKWDTDDASDSRVAYGTSPGSYAFFPDSRCDSGGNVTSHCVNLTGLSANTVYYYKVESKNSDNLDSHSGEYQFTSASGSGGGSSGGGSYPSAPTNVSATVSGSTVNLTWTDTSTDETEFKVFRRLSGGSYSFLASVGAGVVSYSDTNVSSGTYEYYVVACHASGCSDSPSAVSATVGSSTTTTLSSVSQSATVATNNTDTTPPVISNVRVENIIGSGAQVKWMTDDLSDSMVWYGTVSGQHPQMSTWRCDVGGLIKDHCVNFTGLAYTTTYYFRVKSNNQSGYDAMSDEFSFITTGANTSETTSGTSVTSGTETTNTTTPDTTPPTVTQFGYIVESDGRVRAGVTFSEDIDATTVTKSTLYIEAVADKLRVDGAVSMYSRGADYYTAAPLASGISYQLIVTSGVKDLRGNALASFYTSPSFQIGATTTSSSFSVVKEQSFPLDGERGVSTLPKIHVALNAPLDSASTKDQFFSLAPFETPDKVVSGTLVVGAQSFDFTPNTALQANTTYMYRVFNTLRDSSGRWLSQGFSASFTTSGAGVTEASGTLTGVVRDAAGSAVVGAFVEVHTADFTVSRGGETDSQGKYTVANIPPGAYMADLYPPTKNSGLVRPAALSITITSGATLTKDLAFLRATKTIRGTVKRSDGSLVTDARIGAFQSATSRWTEGITDAKGAYALPVSGGSWEVNVSPLSAVADWTYAKAPQSVSFLDDAAFEEKVADFTVLLANARLTGKVLRPDGTPPVPQSVFGTFRSADGKEFGGPVGDDGAFSIAVEAGTYTVWVFSKDASLFALAIPSVTVGVGATVDIGTIRLESRKERISGTIVDTAGKSIGGVRVNAWMREGGQYATALSGEAGEFTLLVSPGIWNVFAEPDPTSQYYNPNPPKQVTVQAGVVVMAGFTLASADAVISGTVVNDAGVLLDDVYGFVSLAKADGGIGGGFSTAFSSSVTGGPIERGKFSFRAPAGSYTLAAFLPSESSYTPGAPQAVTLLTGKTATVSVRVSRNVSVITGVLKDPQGRAITGVDARVFATAKTGIWQEAAVDRATGRYTLKVSAGTWYLGYHIDPATGYLAVASPTISVTVGEGSTVTQDLVAQKAGAVIAGKVTDPDGKPVAQVFVGASQTSFSGVLEAGAFKDPLVSGGETASDGFYRIAVPAGRYFVKAFVHPERGLINSTEVAVTVEDGKIATADLQLRKSDAAITGTVFLDGVSADHAFVWGWSEQGGYQETFSLSDGKFRLNVTGDTKWVVSAASEKDGVAYRANEIAILVARENIIQDIVLAKKQAVPEAVTRTADAAEPTVVSVSAGPTVVVPANAVSTTGSVSVSIAADTRAPSQGEIKVVGNAYSMEARDSGGQIVSSFNSALTVTMPYIESDVKNLGAREADLVMSFWDETVGIWKMLENSVVNTEANTVTAAVDHFTRFAIVAAADVTPPDAPTAVLASVAGGAIGLTWKNPTRDFDHAKIYRSEQSGILGGTRAAEVRGETFTDTMVLSGIKYYYTVRAVDPAGNETANTAQVSAMMRGSAKATTTVVVSDLPRSPVDPPEVFGLSSDIGPGPRLKLIILRNLASGDIGEDVRTLQEFLRDGGFYPEGLITGFFGDLTKRAVIRFQEKHAAEILIPVGEKKGTGFVGARTRAKMGLFSYVPIPKELPVKALPPGQAVKLEILRNLKAGDEGADVRALQEFLRDSGLYPEGLITGFFGDLTKRAVIRFQEKYAAEILVPVGEKKGTGFVGAATRRKVNELAR
ncbi:MAG: carboxypeptidase regulatory-like domain-containing protein [Patescibacteria group bacterium]